MSVSTSLVGTELAVPDALLAPVSWLAWSRKELYASSEDMSLDEGLTGLVRLKSRERYFESVIYKLLNQYGIFGAQEMIHKLKSGFYSPKPMTQRSRCNNDDLGQPADLPTDGWAAKRISFQAKILLEFLIGSKIAKLDVNAWTQILNYVDIRMMRSGQELIR